jgi:hypothetical protein
LALCGHKQGAVDISFVPYFMHSVDCDTVLLQSTRWGVRVFERILGVFQCFGGRRKQNKTDERRNKAHERKMRSHAFA